MDPFRIGAVRSLLPLVVVVMALGCQPSPTASGTPAPSAPRPTQVTAPAATPTPRATPSAPPTASPTPPPTTPPTGACPRLTGATGVSGSSLIEVRIAHQPGFDRVVFDFGRGPLPQYTIEQAASFVAPSGQTVPVQGSAHVGVRFNGAGAMGSYRGPTSFRPGTPLVREVKVVEDFEGVLAWGVGLERLACPQVRVLSGPARLVVDFPTPP